MQGKVERTIGAALFVTGVCAMLAGCAAVPSRPGDASDDGLVPVPTAMMDELFVDPNVPLSNYKRVMVDPVEITFKDDWRKQHPELNDRDFEAFSKELTKMLHDTLVAEFARGGYTLAESPDHDVLRVRASLEDVDFAAPEQNTDRAMQVLSQGRMTLRVKAYDGPSEALVARGRDRNEDPRSQFFKRADRISAQVWAQQVFDEWAQKLRSALDVAKVHAGARTPQQ